MAQKADSIHIYVLCRYVRNVLCANRSLVNHRFLSFERRIRKCGSKYIHLHLKVQQNAYTYIAIYINIYITISYETQVLILQQTSALCIQTAKDGHLRIRNDVVLSADLFCSHLLAHATLDGTAIPTSILASPGVIYGQF